MNGRTNESTKETVAAAAPSDRPTKLPYDSPKLREYGDLKDITMTLHTANSPDGGIVANVLSLDLLRTGGLTLG